MSFPTSWYEVMPNIALCCTTVYLEQKHLRRDMEGSDCNNATASAMHLSCLNRVRRENCNY